MSNNVTVKYSERKFSVTRTLFQYDYGQKLIFEDFILPETYDVHFANANAEDSITVNGDGNGVEIPDECLESGEDIHAWIYVHEDINDGESIYRIIIPIIKRPRIEGVRNNGNEDT